MNLKNRLLIPIGLFSISVIGFSGLIYYGFFFHPKTQVRTFIEETENNFSNAKEDKAQLDTFVSGWEEISKADLDIRISKLSEIKVKFKNFQNTAKNIGLTDELREVKRTMDNFSNKGIEVASNLETIAFYYQKMEKAVKSFNNLNTESKSLDEINKLVMDFKSISETSLSELEKVEAPILLIALDKDYKDLLRQNIKSSADLVDAIGKKDLKRIETIGRESDEAVKNISKQLGADLTAFKENSTFLKELLKMKNMEKFIEESIVNLKNKYGL